MTTLRVLVDAAVRAPNHKRTRPWRFTIVRDAARVRLGALWAQIVADETSLEGTLREALLIREAQKPLRAPAIVVASTRTSDDPVVACEDYAATAAAVENMLLAAYALGLGAIWRTGEMAHRDAINAFLGLAASDRIVAFVYVGEPGAAAPQAPEAAVDDVLRVLA